MQRSPSLTPSVPSPDRVAAGDKAFDPTRHLWVDGVWWSPDGRFRWTGNTWLGPPADPDSGPDRPAVRAPRTRPLTPLQAGVAMGVIAWAAAAVLVYANVRVANNQLLVSSGFSIGSVLLIPLFAGVAGGVLAYLRFRTGGTALEVGLIVMFAPAWYLFTALTRARGSFTQGVTDPVTGGPGRVPRPGREAIPDDVVKEFTAR